MENFYVYILKCADNSYYTGQTDNIEKRISDHLEGVASSYTAMRLPVRLMYVARFSNRNAAFLAERQIKGWSRKKKEALINNDWQKIIELSNRNLLGS